MRGPLQRRGLIIDVGLGQTILERHGCRCGWAKYGVGQEHQRTEYSKDGRSRQVGVETLSPAGIIESWISRKSPHSGDGR